MSGGKGDTLFIRAKSTGTCPGCGAKDVPLYQVNLLILDNRSNELRIEPAMRCPACLAPVGKKIEQAILGNDSRG